MAKLPSAVDLGGISSANSGRQIATYDSQALARGAAAEAGALAREGAAFAEGMQGLGRGLQIAGQNVAAVGLQREQDDERLELARAKSDFLTRKIELDTTVSQDQDHETLTERYGKSIGAIRDEAAAGIKNPRAREMFRLSVADDVAKGNVGAWRRATEVWKDATLADTSDRLKKVQDSIYNTSDPAERTKLIDTGNELITALANKGVYTQTEALAKKQEWVTNYAVGTFSLMPPRERIDALRPFESRLVTRESGGAADRVNEFGFSGMYQFGAPRLTDLGVYTPGKGEKLATWNSSPKDAAGKWSGTFNIPGYPEVKTINDFLGSSGAQKAAFALHTEKMDKEVAEQGFDKYIGKEVGGVTITREGLHAMLHLGGVGGTRKTLESNGADSPKDKNGTSVLDYAKLGVSSGASRIAATLPEPMRREILQNAEKEQAQLDRSAAAAQKAADAEKADLILKEAYSRSNEGKLTPDFVEGARPYLSSEQYKGLLKSLNADATEDTPEAVSDLVKRIDTENPEQFQKSAEQYMREGKLKTVTYISLSEKNRVASRDDQPASPYRSGRESIKSALDPGLLVSGAARAPLAMAQAQALTEFDNWSQANPRASRADVLVQSQEIVRRFQTVGFEGSRMATGASRYFGNKPKQNITEADVEAGEEKLMDDIQNNRLTDAQKVTEINLLNDWRQIIARDNANAAAKAAPRGK